VTAVPVLLAATAEASALYCSPSKDAGLLCIALYCSATLHCHSALTLSRSTLHRPLLLSHTALPLRLNTESVYPLPLPHLNAASTHASTPRVTLNN